MPALQFKLRRWLVGAVALATMAVLFPVATPTADAASTPMLVFSGRGWGHGRGMSQYGAQGYATNYNWSHQQILGHYYSNTDAGTVSDATIRVRLVGMDQRSPFDVTASSGTHIKVDDGAIAIPSTDRIVHVKYQSNPNTGIVGWQIYSRPSTNVGWAYRGTAGETVTIGRYTAGTLSVGGRSYPGSIRAWHTVSGGNHYYRTVAITTAEEYLRGVVPNESPASWHVNALRAQAIAARSYLMAGDSRWVIGGVKYADTCDTTLCQVYDPNTTDARTDQAIRDTAGQVRRMKSNGAIARTEFSSTSGGWTAGGTFPAVQDLGDSISPRHTWSRTVSAAPLESAYGGGSALTSIVVTRRNGLGEWGGRALDVRLTFANGTSRTVTGDDVRRVLGLWSNWFAVGIQNDSVATYINATYQLFVRRNATAAEIERWRDTVARGGRDSLTSALSVSNEWAGAEIRELYRRILGRAPDTTGFNYWMARVRDGYKIEHIAAYFYGGEEYFSRAGSTNRSYVTALYRDILNRPPDSGLNYWTSKLDSHQASRVDVAAGFYAGIESRLQRVTRLYRVILGRDPDRTGRDYWADQLLRIGDVRLAAYLAASEEYYRRVT